MMDGPGRNLMGGGGGGTFGDGSVINRDGRRNLKVRKKQKWRKKKKTKPAAEAALIHLDR